MTDTAIEDCLACGRSHSGRDGEWCSPRCRDASANGWPRYRPVEVKYFDLRWRPMVAKGDGWEIACRCCGGEFVSKGLRCCTPDCERLLRQREEKAAVLAEVGIEPSAKRTCQAPGCIAVIPRFSGVGKGRRAVRNDVRFCSEKCRKRTGRQGSDRTPALSGI
jgi:hypothetical protein